MGGSLIGGIKETQEMLDFCGKHNIGCMVGVRGRGGGAGRVCGKRNVGCRCVCGGGAGRVCGKRNVGAFSMSVLRVCLGGQGEWVGMP